MPQNITDVLAFDSPVVAPSDGDVRNAASVKTGLQNLANRTAYLNDLTGNGGVKRLLTFANLAALRAYTGQVQGDVCAVTGVGMYQFAAAIGTTEVVPTTIVPTGGTAGYWALMGASAQARNTANGIAQLDSGAKLATTYVHGALASLGNVVTSSNIDVTCTGAGNDLPVPGVSVVVTGVGAGDTFLVTGSIQPVMLSGTGAVFSIYYGNSALTTPVISSQASGSYLELPSLGVAGQWARVGGVFQASVAGNVKMQLYVQSGNTNQVRFKTTDISIVRYTA